MFVSCKDRVLMLLSQFINHLKVCHALRYIICHRATIFRYV